MVLSCMDLLGDTVANWDKILVVKWKIAVEEYDVQQSDIFRCQHSLWPFIFSTVSGRTGSFVLVNRGQTHDRARKTPQTTR